MQLLDYALAYAARGWYTLPIRIDRKPDGSKQLNFFRRSWKTATTKPALLLKWWQNKNETGIAILTGPSNLVVIDLDGDDGLKNFRKLCEGRDLPNTLCVHTGGGGYHFYFRAPAGIEIGNSTGTLADHVDVRAKGGCVVAPPSLHSSGALYEWHDASADLADLPEWLTDLLTDTSQTVSLAWQDRAERKLERAVQNIRKAKDGDRNTTLNREAYRIGQLAHLIGHDHVIETLKDACLKADSVLPSTEAESTIERAVAEGEKAPKWTSAPWKKNLLYGIDGNARQCEANVLAILRYHPSLAGTLSYDERKAITIIDRSLPWDKHALTREWSETDSSQAVTWAAGLDPPIVTSVSQVSALVNAVSQDYCVDVFRDWLEDLQWDGVERLDRVLPEICGVEDTILSRVFFRKWLMSAVARTIMPGCQVDTMLVLVGRQGLRKTSFFAELVPWEGLFINRLPRTKDKDATMALRGPVIIEDGEMSMYGAKDIANLKEFLTTRIDRYRAPYARRTCDYPRRCVFCGSTNEDTFLRDATGGRRFWPVEIDMIIPEGVVPVIRDQLWAEAKTRFERGEKWWLDPDEERLAEQCQEDHRESDTLETRLEKTFNEITAAVPGYSISDDQIVNGHLQWVMISQAVKLAGFDATVDRRTQTRIAFALRSLGWRHSGRRVVNGTKQSIWIKKS